MINNSEKHNPLIDQFLPHQEAVAKSLELTKTDIPKAVTDFLDYGLSYTNLRNLFVPLTTAKEIETAENSVILDLSQDPRLSNLDSRVKHLLATPIKPEVTQDTLIAAITNYQLAEQTAFESALTVSNAVYKRFKELDIDANKFPNLLLLQQRNDEKESNLNISKANNECDRLTKQKNITGLSVSLILDSKNVLDVANASILDHQINNGKILPTKDMVMSIRHKLDNRDATLQSLIIELSRTCSGKPFALADLGKSLGYHN